MIGRERSRSVLVDTSAFYSLSVLDDERHEEAQRLIRRLRRDRFNGFTTNAVVAETHALVLSRVRKSRTASEARRRARAVVESIYDGYIEIVRITEEDERAALALLYQFDDQDFSFTDATSFAVMRRLGIGVAFTFDDDFGRAGFADLRHV